MKKFHFLLLALLLFAGLWYWLFPALGFQLDDDSTAYLQMADELAKGHWNRAFNSLWSPLNQWLLFPLLTFTKGWGWTTFYTAQVLNAIFGGLVLLETHLFLRKRGFDLWQHGLFLLALSVALVYYVFLQSFGDILQLLFVIPALHLLWSDDFVKNRQKWLLMAVLMGIASYAKSFNGPFFLVFIALYLIKLLWEKRLTKREAIHRLLLLYLVVAVLLLPASIAYQQQYGVFAPFGLSGKLNLSWMVNGHKAFKAPITFLIPPAYEGAHSLWDDPMLLHGTFTTPFSSGYFFMKYIAKVCINVLIALQCLWQLNLFFLLLLLLQFWKKKRAVLLQKGFWRTDGVFFCGLLIALYVSVHIETRYLLIVLIAAPLIWRQCFTETVFTRIYPWLIGATLLFPVIDTAERWHKNEELFRQAAFLRSKHIEGNITSNAYKSGPSWVLAYLTDSRYYTLENFDVSIEEYLAELKRYHIDYFIEYKEAPHWQLISPDMTTFQELYSTKDFTVYRIR